MQDRFIRSSWITAAAFVVAAAGSARADTVDDRDGIFTHVTILDLEDDQLVFVDNDGRTAERAADTIRSIVLAEGNDPAAADLSKAELLRMQGKRREALDLYKNVVASGQRAWVRDYATMRIVGLCDEMGELWIAYRGYLQLAAEHPRLCERILPRRIPRKDSKVCRDILVDIEAASSQPQSANLAAARERMRRAVLRLPPSDPVAKSPAVPAPGKPGPVEAPPAANLRPPADSPLSPRLAAVRDALLTGDLDAATRRLEECRALARPRDESALLLLDAQLAWARGDVRGAGLRAMQIVAGYPNSPEVAEALFVTGQTHEKLNRPEKALELYQRSAADARASEDLKRRARERINALAPATASGTPPAGGTP